MGGGYRNVPVSLTRFHHCGRTVVATFGNVCFFFEHEYCYLCALDWLNTTFLEPFYTKRREGTSMNTICQHFTRDGYLIIIKLDFIIGANHPKLLGYLSTKWILEKIDPWLAKFFNLFIYHTSFISYIADIYIINNIKLIINLNQSYNYM